MDNSQAVTESNNPLVLNTSLPFELQPIVMETDMAYLMQVQGYTNLFFQSGYTDFFDLNIPYVIDNIEQLFYFTPVAGGSYCPRPPYSFRM